MEKYHTTKMQPKLEDIELNKCIHNAENIDSKCPICGSKIDTNMDLEKLLSSADTLISYLETMKMVSNTVLTSKEIKAAQKYFDMIPLLKNIESIYNICKDEFEHYIYYIEENEDIENISDQLDATNAL
jgi:hypothetical protein